MARDDVGERADGERVAARDAAARPRLLRQPAEERVRREPDGAELVDVLRPGSLIGVRLGDRRVLVEARQRAVEAAREPERAEGEQSLNVVDVAPDLADRPLLRS